MNLIDNRRWLNNNFPEVADYLRDKYEQEATGEVIVEPSRRGDLTLKLNVDGVMKYVYSKYDPLKDAERILRQFDVQISGVAIFFGVGLGYQIDEFFNQHPHRKIVIIEPNEEAFLEFLKHKKLSRMKKNRIMGIHVGLNNIEGFMTGIVNETKGKVQFISLSYYDEIYHEILITLKGMLKKYLKDQRFLMSTFTAFQLRWILNVLNNFPTLLKTPNFLHENKVDENQIAIIVAAGPSLDYEINNLKKIKKDNSCHIFSVGSAINALIANDIYPDATLSYDPQGINEKVVQRIKDEGITDIPLIYGSRVGYETLVDYPGSMFHLLMLDDKLSAQILYEQEPILVVDEAPTIAVVTLHMLILMGFKKIILVGQNLGYSQDTYYAQGIKYDYVNPNFKTEEMDDKPIYTIDVEGNEIRTNEGFQRMKTSYEYYINNADGVEVINTTVGGAHIEGTTYKRLEQLLNDNYFDSGEKLNLFQLNNEYNLGYTMEKIEHFVGEKGKVVQHLKSGIEKLKEIQLAAKLNKQKNLERLFSEFDNLHSNVEDNDYYKYVLQPTLTVQYEQLLDYVAEVRYHSDLVRKAYIITNAFNTYLNEIYKHYIILEPYFEKMVEESSEIIQRRMQEDK